MNKEYKFPKDFLWGSATSSHQVEGNCENNWSEWEKSPQRLKALKKEGLIKRYGKENFISGLACDHWNQYKDDFKLAKDLGQNAFRLSIEWSKIEPEEGNFSQEAIDHYIDVINTLRSLEIEPIVTLWHWSIPLWLDKKGGLLSKDILKYFERYTERISSTLKDKVKFWITINEPHIYTSQAYVSAEWPPQNKNLFSFLKALLNLVKIHKTCYKVIKETNPESQIGISKNNSYFEITKNNVINNFLAKTGNYFSNHWFLDQIRNEQDFIGLNYYFHNLVDGKFKFGATNEMKNELVSDIGTELYPKGIYYVLKDLSKRYGKPILITENGLADAKDNYRKWFIYESLKAIHKAIKEGIDVQGYLHWSLLDNFEWSHGFWPKFGLVEVDHKTQKRKIRDSAKFYANICKTGKIDEIENILNDLKSE